jgi:hypothetical protein
MLKRKIISIGIMSIFLLSGFVSLSTAKTLNTKDAITVNSYEDYDMIAYVHIDINKINPYFLIPNPISAKFEKTTDITEDTDKIRVKINVTVEGTLHDDFSDDGFLTVFSGLKVNSFYTISGPREPHMIGFREERSIEFSYEYDGIVDLEDIKNKSAIYEKFKSLAFEAYGKAACHLNSNKGGRYGVLHSDYETFKVSFKESISKPRIGQLIFNNILQKFPNLIPILRSSLLKQLLTR